MITTTLLLVYLHGANAVPTWFGSFDTQYECMLAKYKRPQTHKMICVPADTEIPYLSDY